MIKLCTCDHKKSRLNSASFIHIKFVWIGEKLCLQIVRYEVGAKIHRCSCTACAEEKVANHRNIQWWQMMFQKGRTNIHDNSCKRVTTSTMLDKTVQWEHALFKDDHHLTITYMWWEIAAQLSHKASEATIVCALQQLEMQKNCAYWVPQQLKEKHWKTCIGVIFNFLTQYKENGNDLFEWIITGNES